MKKTKIVCTIGPSCSDIEILKKMINEGMDVVRLNLSHSTHEFAEDIVKKIRKLNKELNTNVGILFDTKGPEIRVGTFKDGSIELKENDKVLLTPNKADGTNLRINISERKLSLDLDIDNRILIDDGNIELNVIGIKNEDITCKVIRGGILKDNKTINIPDVDLNIDFLSYVDKKDILFASKLNVDFIALSFIRSANDILDVNDMLIGERNEHTQIISKIETKNAIEDLENIIKVSDGIMIARGDLGVEIELEKLPCIQKRIVKETKNKNKICIVATEMLSSMEVKPRPTRAELSDISNAVIDGVDALVLTGETAIGNYPIETVKTMYKTIIETEKDLDYNKLLQDKHLDKNQDLTAILAYSAVDATNMLKAKALVVSSISGYTARKISTFKPSAPIILTTPHKDVATSLSLNWGIIPVVVNKFSSTDEIVENAKEVAKNIVKIEKGDRIVITGGFPIKNVRGTNFIKIEEF